MTDKELLGLAAKAAGLVMRTRDCDDGEPSVDDVLWNPLTDGGDSMQLANLLSIDVLHRFVGGRRSEALAPGGEVHSAYIQQGDDVSAATRRAIVRAAAAIGKTVTP